MSTLLEVCDLEVCYDGAPALAGVSLTIEENTILAVVGANGAGKTTLVRAICGLIRPAAGWIRFAGEDITGLDPAEICALGISQVPEGRQLFASLTVHENLLLGAEPARAWRRRRQNLERVLALFPRLAERLEQRAGTLSGGEQQMLAIARCLMAEPRLVLFDEPSLGLAPKIVAELFAVLRQLHAEGCSMLLVEQNVADSLRLCHRACVLEQGHIVLAGSGEALLANADIRRAYLGL